MFLHDPPTTDELRAEFDSAKAADGYLANHTRLWGWRFDLNNAFGELRGRLLDSTSLDERECALVVSTTASAMGDSYCSLAWGTRLASLIGDAQAASIVQQRDPKTLTKRESALTLWVRKVVRDANSTTQDDVDALRAAGLNDREIFEATLLAGFRVAFSMVNDALGASPDREVYDAAPPNLQAAVTFGRPTSSE